MKKHQKKYIQAHTTLERSFGPFIWGKWEVGGERVVWGTLLVVKTKVAGISDKKNNRKIYQAQTTHSGIVWAVDMVG